MGTFPNDVVRILVDETIPESKWVRVRRLLKQGWWFISTCGGTDQGLLAPRPGPKRPVLYECGGRNCHELSRCKVSSAHKRRSANRKPRPVVSLRVGGRVP